MKTTLFLRSIIIFALTGAVLALSISGGAASLATFKSHAAAKYVSDEVLVKFKPTSVQERAAIVAARGHSVFATLSQPGWVQVKIGTGQTVEAALAAYENDPSVQYVQPNYIYHITAAPNDTQYGQLWAFKNTGQTISTGTYNPTSGTPGDDMNIEPAWGHITDCSSVVVAVIDSGVNYDQEDLAGNMWNGANYPNHGWNYVDGNNDPMDRNGHGTHVAGIIGAAGNNAKGVTGVCWKASIMAVRVMDPAGSGNTANITQGVNFAVNNGAKVINMSLGGGGTEDMAYSDVITNAQTHDVVVVVAAGNASSNNDAANSADWPCNFTQPNLICVAALDQNYALASFSNYGTTSVDVGAPGTNILSTWAGTTTVITDPLNAGWTRTTTTTGGFVYGIYAGYNSLLDPANYLNVVYASNTDDRAYKQFNFSGYDAGYIDGLFCVNVMCDGAFSVASRSNVSGDPFAVASPTYLWGPYCTDTAFPSTNYCFEIKEDISSGISQTCTLGVQLITGAVPDIGVAIPIFTINMLTHNVTGYHTIDGTSMATPEVAGLATMLRAYNPQYTYADTLNAIKQGGRATASLAGKTTTGKAIDVMSSLSYISTPTGLTATVQ